MSIVLELIAQTHYSDQMINQTPNLTKLLHERKDAKKCERTVNWLSNIKLEPSVMKVRLRSVVRSI